MIKAANCFSLLQRRRFEKNWNYFTSFTSTFEVLVDAADALKGTTCSWGWTGISRGGWLLPLDCLVGTDLWFRPRRAWFRDRTSCPGRRLRGRWSAPTRMSWREIGHSCWKHNQLARGLGPSTCARPSESYSCRWQLSGQYPIYFFSIGCSLVGSVGRAEGLPVLSQALCSSVRDRSWMWTRQQLEPQLFHWLLFSLL